MLLVSVNLVINVYARVLAKVGTQPVCLWAPLENRGQVGRVMHGGQVFHLILESLVDTNTIK